MFEAALTEFPFVADLPKRERSKVGKLWDTFRELSRTLDAKGNVVPQGFAADLLGVSPQRVGQLLDAGKLEPVTVGGRRFVTEASILAHAATERKTGRPVKKLSNPEIWSAAKRSAAELTGRK